MSLNARLTDDRTAASKRPAKRSAHYRPGITPISSPPTNSILNRKSTCACGGGCPKCLASLGIQPKLKIGAPNDKYEQEADRVADTVMRMPDPQVQRQSMEEAEEEELQTKPLLGTLQRQAVGDEEEEEALQTKRQEGVIQRQAEGEEEEEEEELQTKARPGHTPTVGPTAHDKIRSLQGGGQPLPVETRTFFELRMGRDFSHVRVHSDSGAARAAQSVQARAFALGHNVVFGAGEYSPDTSSGRKLLAHELTHVVQQGGLGNLTLQRSPGPVKSASHEIYCYEPKTISGFSDKKLIREMTKVRSAINKGFNGYCQTEEGTIKAPWQYYRDLDIEATGRGLLTHPTGITTTTAAGYSLNYGTDFTHTLDISAGGSSSDLRGSEITEELSVPRDDFHFNQTIKEDTWTLGKMKRASPTPGKFTDRNFTPANLVQNKCANSYVDAIPPVRVEVQKLKWRRVSTENWNPPFFTNRIIFKLVRDRRGRYWAVSINRAVGINKGVVHKERYYGGYPPRTRP